VKGQGRLSKRKVVTFQIFLAKGAFILGGDYSMRPMFEGVINGGGRIFCGIMAN